MKKEKKRISLGLAAILSVGITYFSVETFKEFLPQEIREEIDKLDENISRRIPEEDKNRFEEFRSHYNRTITSIDQRINDLANQKLAELESEIAEKNKTENSSTTQQSTQIQNNSQAVKNLSFQHYNFSDETYFKMVKLAAAEEGRENKRGMAVEMSVMFNVFEGMGGKFQGLEGEEGFIKLISTSIGNGGRFTNADIITSKENGDEGNPMPRDAALTKEMIEIAKRIAGGERYAPPFIDRHCSLRSVESLTTDGVTTTDKNNKNNYIKKKTIIKQARNGGYFTFYGFLAETSASIKDPYGYTKGNEVGKPDEYYDFDTRKPIINGVMMEQRPNVELGR